MTAILFGSIGTLADTSEIQRQAFNDAFERHGLDWRWSQQEYRGLLLESGGERRITEYADGRGEQVDAAAIHATKSELFRATLRARPLPPRTGVVETIARARSEGAKVALVTTTAADNVAALGEALRPTVELADFALLVDTDDVESRKPAPDVYAYALAQLGERAETCVAIEDNVGGAESAAAAGIACVAFPGENNAEHDFAVATVRVDALDPAEVIGAIGR